MNRLTNTEKTLPNGETVVLIIIGFAIFWAINSKTSIDCTRIVRVFES